MPSRSDRNSPCPLCRSSESEEVQTQVLALAGLDTVQIGFGYCRACGHIYQVRPAPPAILDEHYACFSNYTCFDPDAARKAPPSASTRRLLRLAEARAPRAGKVYEVGCATGYHLVQFRRAGWDVGGCDPSPKAAAQAQELFGIAVDCHLEAEILPRQRDLAVVLFSHVLEHLSDPLAALCRARDALRDDGVVLLEVPCAIAPHLMPPGWFTFEHLHYFSQNSLLGMLDEAGLAPLEMRIAFKEEIYPVIAAIACKTSDRGKPAKDPIAPAQARQFLDGLVRRDDAIWGATSRRVRNVAGPAYVWGAGVHTAQLFDRTELLRGAQVLGIVDRDDQKWGRRQAGREIISPEVFRKRYDEEPVVISSYASEAQIASRLTQYGIAPDRIVRLYG